MDRRRSRRGLHKFVGTKSPSRLPPRYSVVEMVGGRWGILIDGIQTGPGPRDPSGASSFTVSTHRKAVSWAWTNFQEGQDSLRAALLPPQPNPRGTLPTYSGHRPTGFDPHLPLAGREDWLIVPVSRNRDSGMLDESNFEQALEALGGESDDVEVHRFGHWGPGWYEIIIVRPGSKAEKEAEEIEAALANYPVLNDEDHSQREYDATISNIRQVLSSVENKNNIEEEFPEDTAEKIFGWLWTNDQRQLDNRDDQGGYPSDEAVEEALRGLGLWAGPPDEEGNVPELPEHVKQEERERGGQRRLPGVEENPTRQAIDDAWAEDMRRGLGTVGHNRHFTARELAEHLGVSQPRTQRHLQKLQRAGYVGLDADGYYVTGLGWTWIEGGASEAKEHSTQRLQVGNAFYAPARSGPASWKRITNDDWQPVVVGEDEVERAEIVGYRLIDGVMHDIFEMHFAPGSRGYYAQMQHMTHGPGAAHEALAANDFTSPKDAIEHAQRTWQATHVDFHGTRNRPTVYGTKDNARWKKTLYKEKGKFHWPDKFAKGPKRLHGAIEIPTIVVVRPRLPSGYTAPELRPRGGPAPAPVSILPAPEPSRTGFLSEAHDTPAKRIDRRKLGEMMSPWGGDFAYGEGIGSVGAVASFYFSDKPYPQREYVEKAIRAIEADIPQAERGMHGWTKKDAKELRTIASGLRYYLAKDYKGGAETNPKTNPEAKDWDADELVLYADNTYELYGMKQAIQKNLLKKKKAGTYKPKLAEVAWMHFADAAAKRYAKEMKTGGKWYDLFPVPVREEAAAQWARTFEESGFEIG